MDNGAIVSGQSFQGRNILVKLSYISVIAALPLVALTAPAQAKRGDKIPDSYICVFKDSEVSSSDALAESDKAVKAGGGTLKHVYRAALKGFSANMSAQGLENSKRMNSNIAYCEQDQEVDIPPVEMSAAPGGGTVTIQAQETPWGISRVRGGISGATGTAWVIDTGIQSNHPDLRLDTARSRSFLGKRTTPWDQNGHGTHVAGTIAARDDTNGVIGVAAGALLVSVRVLDRNGSGSNSGVIAGVDYVAANGKAGDVANMSLGGGVSQALDDAVIRAAAGGVRFALAAGNSSTSATTSSPARVNGTNIFTVSSFAIGDNWSSFSNYGNPPIDFAEPGSAIKSTWINSGYNTISGTSMATPHLAGLLLLGPVNSGGTVIGDPDGNPDVIGVR